MGMGNIGVTLSAPRVQQTAECEQEAESVGEWIKSEDGITEEMTRLNGVYVRYVSTSPPRGEQDDV